MKCKVLHNKATYADLNEESAVYG